MLVIWKSLKFVNGKLKAIVKILRKGENCGKEHFLLFSMFELLPNDKISDKSKLKEIADYSCVESIEIIVDKGGYAGYQHFLLFPQYFLKTSFFRVFKVGIVC